MDSSGSLERTSRLRFALQTPSPCSDDADDGIAERRELPERSDRNDRNELPDRGERSDRPERSDRNERSDRSERLDRSDSGARERGDRAAAETSQGGQIVLLVEDNPEVVAAVVHCLHGAGYRTLCAANVEDAVRKVNSRAVALVLLNWGLLLRIGGSDLIGQLRASSPRARLPMVVISDEVSALNEASSLGIEDYVLDPFQLDDLLHVVDEHCC